MFLRAEDWKDSVSFPADDPAVRRYLRGETVDATESGSGYRLFCVDGYPLGFVKQDKLRYKKSLFAGLEDAAMSLMRADKLLASAGDRNQK